MEATGLLPRAKAIRLSVAELARRTKFDKHTILRIDAPDRSPLVSTKEAVARAIAADEIALRDYLIGLHGVPQAERAA